MITVSSKPYASSMLHRAETGIVSGKSWLRSVLFPWDAAMSTDYQLYAKCWTVVAADDYRSWDWIVLNCSSDLTGASFNRFVGNAST